jgi:hypothetical protein
MVPLRVHRELKELRDQRLTVEIISRANSGIWTIIESRAPGGDKSSRGPGWPDGWPDGWPERVAAFGIKWYKSTRETVVLNFPLVLGIFLNFP